MIRIIVQGCFFLLICGSTTFAAENYSVLNIGDELPSALVSSIQYGESNIPPKGTYVAYQGIDPDPENRTFYKGKVKKGDITSSLIEITCDNETVIDTNLLHYIYSIGDKLEESEVMQFQAGKSPQKGDLVGYEFFDETYVGQVKKCIDGKYQVHMGSLCVEYFEIKDLKKLRGFKESVK